MKQSDVIQLATTKIRQIARSGSNRVLKGLVLDLYVLGLQEGMRLMAEQLKDRITPADTNTKTEVPNDIESTSDGNNNSGVGG
jgi:hypothetical protein